MTTELEMAQERLEPNVKDEIYWFVPDGKKHFIDPLTISVAASVLLSLFFTGVYEGLKDAAKTEGKQVGESLGKKAIELMRSAIAGDKPAEAEQVENKAKAAQEIVKGSDRVVTEVVFEKIEIDMQTEFATVMPANRAEALARHVRTSATKVIYKEVEQS